MHETENLSLFLLYSCKIIQIINIKMLGNRYRNKYQNPLSFSLFYHFNLSFTGSFPEFIHVYCSSTKQEETEAENSNFQCYVLFIYSLIFFFPLKSDLLKNILAINSSKQIFNPYFALITAIKTLTLVI